MNRPRRSWDEPGVLIVDELSVAEAARLQPDLVLGIITRGGGPTGHVAIVARSLGIPAVVGVTDLSPTSYVGSRVAMDGTTGEVFIEPDSVVWAGYRQRQDDYQQAIVLASRYPRYEDPVSRQGVARSRKRWWSY